MSPEIQMAVQRLLVPGLCALLGCYLISTTDRGEDWYDDEPEKGTGFLTFLGAFIAGCGMIAADLWQRDILVKPMEWLQWKASYQWQWMVWAIPASMLIFAIARRLFGTPIHYVGIASTLTCTLAAAILLVSMNEGSVWLDQSEKWLPWFAGGIIAIVWNVLALNSIARSGGSRWVTLVVLAQFGCVGAVVLQAYGSLGEWALTGVGASIGASVIALLRGSTAKLLFGWQLSTVMIPLSIMAVTCLVVGQFFESSSMPSWVTQCVLFLPTVVGAFDLLIGRLANPLGRAILAATVSSAILGAILYFYFSKPATPEW